MAASPLNFTQAVPHPDLDIFFREGEWDQERHAAARALLDRAKAENETLDQRALSETTSHIDTLSAAMSENMELDVDDTMEYFEEAEDRCRLDKREVLKDIDRAIKIVARSQPEALVIVNELYSLVSASYNKMASIYRDARWRLMALRATSQPSAGVGAIHGSGEPPEGVEVAA